MPQDRYNLDLTREQVDYMAKILAREPWNEVQDLMQTMLRQISQQNENTPEKPAPDGVASGDQP